MAGFLLVLLFVAGLFMMFIVLLQRGRGGGLAGALGGMGGASAFGTKAGDVFTKITIGVAVVWVLLSGVSGIAARRSNEGTRSSALDDGLVRKKDSDENAPPILNAEDSDDAADDLNVPGDPVPGTPDAETPALKGDAPDTTVDDAATGDATTGGADESAAPPSDASSGKDSGDDSAKSKDEAKSEDE